MTKAEKLSHDILDAEIRLTNINSSLNRIAKDLATLSFTEIQLNRNVMVLKEKGIITTVNEYKKIRTELNSVRSKKNALLKDGLDLDNIRKVAENLLDKLKQEYEAVNSNKSNVIKGNFGNKNG